ncbi:MAG TPA: ATP-dependent DNA ligase [Myxococcota bacterium]
MRRFAELFSRLDETNKTSAKKQALVDYFAAAPADDAAWAVRFLVGDRPKRAVATKTLTDAVCAAADIPTWLFDECYEQAGDLSETLALLLPGASSTPTPPSLTAFVETRLLPLKALDAEAAMASVRESWGMLEPQERLVFNKLLGGSFRVGVAKGVVVQALAAAADVDTATIAARLVGGIEATAAAFAALTAPASTTDTTDATTTTTTTDPAKPYPFFLASPIPGAHPESLGPPAAFVIEPKWDGIRAQLVVRDVDGEKRAWLWSRGEEEVSAAFPDVIAAARSLPAGTVLDGELLAWDVEDDVVRSFNDLQQRLNRKKPSAKLVTDTPVRLLTYDLLEEGGVDLRAQPIAERRRRLELLAPAHGFAISERLHADSWADLDARWQQSRSLGVEGFMLKAIDSPYRAGRVRGEWWKWKVAPLSVDCVLVYAQKGSGKRAGLYSDYTFAVWDRPASSSSEAAPRQLVTFAKAYSGLTDDELKKVDAFIKRNTTERFGPVRAVTPTIVVELGFEGINESTRHKSGFAVRFPRILRLRDDKAAEDADTVDDLRALLLPPT